MKYLSCCISRASGHFYFSEFEFDCTKNPGKIKQATVSFEDHGGVFPLGNRFIVNRYVTLDIYSKIPSLFSHSDNT